MNDATNPPAEVETTTPAEAAETGQAEAQEAEPGEGESQARDEKGRFTRQGDDGEPDEAAAAEPAAEPEYEELEFEGERISIPKGSKLKDGLMRQADYTRKTQEVAEQRKQAEAAIADIQKQAQQQQADFQEYAELYAWEKYLESFKSIDWNKAMEEDPIAANKQFIEFQTRNAELQDRRHKLQQKQSEHALQAQRETARREEEGREMLRQTIKGWSPETESALKAFAKERGVPNADSVQFAMHPQEARILHEAYLYRELMKKAQAKPITPEPKPVKTVGQASRSSPNRLDDDLTVDEWMKRREAALRRKP